MTDNAEKFRKEETIRDLQKMRRANNGMRGCAEILIQHSVNKESVKTYPCANIVLTVQQEAGLHYVIEACAGLIDKLFYDIEDDLNIEWTEDHLPEVREEAESLGAYLSGKTSFEQFKKENGIDPNLQRSIGHTIIDSIRSGKPFHRLGGGKFVHVEDVAAAVVATVGNPDAAGKVYNLADCYARWADWALMAGELLGLEVEIDTSSPPQPKNTFAKDAARSLGVELDRDHDGIREHLRELIALMDTQDPGRL